MLVPIALAASLLVSAPAMHEGSERLNHPPDRADAARDTLRITRPADPRPRRRLFEQRILFSPEYLSRLASAGLRTPAALPSSATAPDALERARLYADKYRISEALALQIIEAAFAQGLDPDLGFRVIRVESVFNPNARGSSGSLGLTQLMPATARWLDRSLRTEAAILDPANNLRVGFQYLRSLIERYDGNVQLALLAYNRGSGIVDRALRQGRDPENGYTKLVLELNGDQYVGTGLVTLSTSRSQRAPRRRRSVAPDSTRRARA